MRHAECIAGSANGPDRGSLSSKPISFSALKLLSFMRNFFSNALILFTALAFLPQPLLQAGTEIVRMNRSVIPRFTLEQAILTALQRNASIQIAREEIERTKGLYIAVRAEALPQIGANLNAQHTDPKLGSISKGGGSGGLSGVPTQYSISLQATQVVFAGGRVISNIR